MKKTALFSILVAGIAFNTVVLANGFNERGEDFIANVQPGSGVSSQVVAVAPQGFNQRGVNYITEAPTGSTTAGNGVYITSAGFNERSFNTIN